MSEWQPIETLPFTDATPFLAYCDHCVVHLLKRRDGKFWRAGSATLLPFPERLTHWMPLPDPPVIGSEKKAAPENSVATRRSAAPK